VRGRQTAQGLVNMRYRRHFPRQQGQGQAQAQVRLPVQGQAQGPMPAMMLRVGQVGQSRQSRQGHLECLLAKTERLSPGSRTLP